MATPPVTTRAPDAVDVLVVVLVMATLEANVDCSDATVVIMDDDVTVDVTSKVSSAVKTPVTRRSPVKPRLLAIDIFPTSLTPKTGTDEAALLKISNPLGANKVAFPEASIPSSLKSAPLSKDMSVLP
jgi:hypothetical protein